MPHPCVHVTHVLEFVPPWMTEPTVTGDRFWSLQTLADYEAGTPGTTYDEAVPPDVADPGHWLTQWTSAQLGYPVILTPGTQEVRLRRPFSRWRTEPVYYVSRHPGRGA